MTIAKIPGVTMTLNGQEYVLPPIALGPLRVLQDRLKDLSGATDPLNPEAIDTIVDAAFASLKRNYPAITREEVGDLVDLGNMMEVLRSVMDVSGMFKKAREEGKLIAGVPPTGTESSAT